MSEFPAGSVWAPKSGRGYTREVIEAPWPLRDGVWYQAILTGGRRGVRNLCSAASFRRWAGKRLDMDSYGDEPTRYVPELDTNP